MLIISSSTEQKLIRETPSSSSSKDMMNAPQYQHRTTVVDQEDQGQVAIRRLSSLYSSSCSSSSYNDQQMVIKNDKEQQQRPSKRQRTTTASSPSSVSKPVNNAADAKSYPTSKSIMSPTSKSQSQKHQQRIRFTLFLKILLTRLEKEQDHELLNRAREIVAHCNWMNKTGDPNYSDLVSSLEVPLRDLVGEIHWIRSHTYMNYYISNVLPLNKKKKNVKKNNVSSMVMMKTN